MIAPEQILEQQRAFFASGKTKDISFRIKQLEILRKLLQVNEKALIEAVHQDFKKPPFETYGTEIGLVLSELSFAIKNVESWAKPQSVSSSLVNFPSKNYMLTEPYGNALIISPWNYPVMLALLPLVGALAAGNTAVIKPSELTPNTSAVLEELIRSHFETELVSVIEGGVEESQLLLSLPFNYIFFTGSTRVGKIIMKAAAENLTPVTLELGGKSPCIVDASANLEISAKRIVWGKFVNAGQTCVAPDYLMVERGIKEEFTGYLEQAITQLYGEDPEQSPDYPRVINRDHFDRLSTLIDPEKVITGGQTNAESNYIAPTIMTDITWDDPVMQDEIFGPILPVLEYQSVDECIQTINSYPRPLALYLFCSDTQIEQKVLNEVSFGGGAVNDTIAQLGNHHLSFGGVGASGFGSYHGKASFDSFSHKKSVMKKPFWPDIPVRYAPYDDLKLNLVKKVLK